MAHDQVLIEWFDSPEMRRSRARWQRQRLLRLSRWFLPLACALFGLVILLILLAAPWAAKALPWWRLYLAGCISALVLLAITTLFASVPSPANHYALTELGVNTGSRFYRWNRIVGYHTNLGVDGVTIVHLVLAYGRRCSLEIPPTVSSADVLAIVSSRLPAIPLTNRPRLTMSEIVKPTPVLFTAIWSVLGALLVGYGLSPALVMMSTLCVGPGVAWMLTCHWKRVRESPWILIDTGILNVFACTAVMFVATLFFLNRITLD